MRRIFTNTGLGAVVVFVAVVLAFFGVVAVEGTTLTEVELEDDYLVATKELEQQCVHRCPDQNRTGFNEHIDVSCGSDCYLTQCAVGCRLWELALESSCQNVCNKTDQELLEPKELYCVMGCNDALNRYFKWLKAEIGTPPAPALVADSLTATSLSLEWEIPERSVQLSRQKSRGPRSYLVQWRYEEVAGDWKFCRNQSMGDNSTIRVDNLQPYTKYRFRVALLLSPPHDEVLISEQSVIILTSAQGPPKSEPKIVRAVAVDYSRISISWEPGPFPNGPILSYVLQIKDIDPLGYSALKDIPESNTSRHYMFEKLAPERNYSVSVTMRNPEGEGPPSTTFVRTPVQPLDLEEDISPTLILGAEHAVLSQGTSNLLSASPTNFYRSPSHRIRGTAVHIRRNLIFVSDDAGFIYKAPLRLAAEKGRIAILLPEAGHNFRPTLLSVDWLNDHLYILGQAKSTALWQISRCDFSGDRMTVAIAGLQRQPEHFEVDPFNGYLFWVISSRTPDAGLFRLDLGDISNGVKHEIKPLQLNNHHNLGAFSIDHTSFRVLVPDQDANTVLAISLDGKTTENIRSNTQRPRFEKVKSIALANGLFYWTNGKELLAEDYHLKQDSYFHNAFPIDANTTTHTYFSICVNLSSAQPIPVPVNPPRNVQALLTNNKIKIFWNEPHLLGIKGKGAWQEWMYELELSEEDSGKVVAYPEINETSFVSMDVDLLAPGKGYVIKAAAYTHAGRGPWSTEFRARTLKDAHERHLVWSGSEGIMRSDVIGDSVETLISRTELEDGVVTDIAWFESILYVVSNSTLLFYNQSEGQISKLRELESVECVTVDWIGRRLYFYNPSQQMIMRSSLHGEQHEPIHNVKNVREIKFDALRGYIYYTSEFAMEAFRLNGKDRHSYYLESDRFTGKGVIGLTLDMDSEKVYWIVRSISNSELFSAHMAGTGSTKVSSLVTVLAEQSPRGPLTHFSDRLLWLQQDEVVIGDLRGENLAHIRNQKLNGTRAFTIIDPAHHLYPEDNQNVNVLPMQVNDTSIRIQGTWKKFNIVWDPVTNVNYGKVFYKITIKVKGKKDEIHELHKPSHIYNSSGANLLPPHTEINVTINAFTYWRSSVFSSARLFSPSGKPSQPTRPRVFVKHVKDPIQDIHTVDATFRWSPPKTPNGPIIGYKVHCWYEEDGLTNHVLQSELTNRTERIVQNLVHNVTYFFRVQALTKAREGDLTAVQSINTSEDHPIPQALIATADHIIKVDFDSGESRQVVSTSTPVMFMARLARERKLFWVDENNELFQYDGTSKSKLFSIGGPVLSLTIDWIRRILYWSQQEVIGSAIYSFDLNRFENEGVHVEKLVYSASNMTNLVVAPFERKLFWTEKVPEDVIYVHDFDENRTEEFFDDSFEECPNRTAGITVYPMLALQTSVSEEARLFWAETGFRSVGLSSRTCMNFGFEYYPKMKSIAKDSDHFYWLEDDEAIVRMDDGGELQSKTIPGAKALLPLQLQYYPERRCLIPLQKNQDYQAKLLQRTENSLTLLLPKAEVHLNCSTEPSGIRYVIYYDESDANRTEEDCDPANCSFVTSYDRSKTIKGLKPFTRYRFQVLLLNYYQEQFGPTGELDNPRVGSVTVFSTAAGAPSKPQDISVLAISPTEAVVRWSPPLAKNSERVWYEIHWQTEYIHDGSKNRQQQLVTDFDEDSTSLSINLTKLQPNQAYTIWIMAYSTESTYSESDHVNIVTFPEPEDIRLVFNSSTELGVSWRPHMNISTYKVQYSAVGSKTWETVFETDVNTTIPESGIFHVSGLQPKTQYRFIVLLFYPNRKEPYVWPPDARFIYETEADRPSAPGQPIVTLIRQDVYKVSWEPSKDNGAPILEYALEALVRSPRTTNRVERAALAPESGEELEDDSLEDMNNTIPTRVDVGSTDSQEYQTFDERWDLVYNGTDVYWIIPEKQPIHKHTFRVRARNSCGWGPFSGESEPISQPLLSGQTGFYLMITVIFGAAIFLIFLLLIFVCAFRRAEIEKKNFIDATTTRIPDVELANLRELPRRGNFIHSQNILYSSGPLTDSEIALLPQIRREQITMTSSPFLGSGAFGEVYEGIVKGVGDGVETRVAIKTLRKGATEQEKAEFLQEAHLMSNFKHKHILKLIGICLDLDSLYIIMELMRGGDLLSYLRSNRPTPGNPSPLTLLDLITMCVDVATGCRYLEEMHFVHRDLACRNCLVSSPDPKERVVKIGDFGLARDIYKNDYYRKEGEGLLPVRWMSPESLVDGVFTSQSDIWAFGVLLWEIMTLGQQPYPARNNLEVLHYVRDGGRLTRPQDCPDELYQLMMKCWSYSPDDRPTFRYCLDILQSLEKRTSDSIQITSQFPCKVQNDIKFGNSGSGGAFIITPPTSSSSSGATVMSTMIPKYLELVYDDSNSTNSKCSTGGEDVPLTAGLMNSLPMPTDNGYEIPIHQIILQQQQQQQQHPSCSSNKGRTFSSSSTVSTASTLPASMAAHHHHQHQPQQPRVEDCSSLEALLPINSILTVKLPAETTSDRDQGGQEASLPCDDANDDSINSGAQLTMVNECKTSM
ncbi:proto-oncogene tyrosine-protein kinase ROS isoform X2 [Wyeomyia smithii]|uniref:proto-oncogene tyrosine-protein kinase ROS isoform X2 n=1 Tax=Wyeomyia smithii TaxID=174621 RepID=UPI002468174B|nr:proto-oncogene tyrosine-protein kinase ROS isoform X2 [Wyeomyia smithii]